MKLQFCFLAALMMGTNAMAVEEPKFETVMQEAKFEVRQYARSLLPRPGLMVTWTPLRARDSGE